LKDLVKKKCKSLSILKMYYLSTRWIKIRREVVIERGNIEADLGVIVGRVKQNKIREGRDQGLEMNLKSL
jgi:hypothetical protein